MGWDSSWARRMGAGVAACIALAVAPPAAAGDACGKAVPLLPNTTPTRLVVITPATGQSGADWQPFIERMKKEPGADDMALLVYEHGIHLTSAGTAQLHAKELGACVKEKLAADPRLAKVTLIGHSIGGMLVRRAYLDAFAEAGSDDARWAPKVDRILLFASVNRGVAFKAGEPGTAWWMPAGDWARRNLPRFGLRFVLEDMVQGSDFIADVRIEWIRRFGQLAQDGRVPRVVQFWGRDDSIVNATDNKDLAAFNGDVLETISGATHGDLPKLGSASDPDARWAIFRKHLFAPAAEVAAVKPHEKRRVLFILRGIRDSANSEWVTDLKAQAEAIYGKGNVIAPEYGYFTAAKFAMKPMRQKNIPSFRDTYAETLAENPNTEFDVIAHSNGTYIVAESLRTTPAMRLRHVVFAAPVLPVEFDWDALFRNKQVARVRYDTASADWPVGILCPALRALGFTDVGPAGLVDFGSPVKWADDQGMRKVGWYAGGHGAALEPTTRTHLLSFADKGEDFGAGAELNHKEGSLAPWSRATPWLVWGMLLAAAYGIWRWRRRSTHRFAWLRIGGSLLAGFVVVYALLDVF